MRRGRVMLLTLLAFAWPTAALANSVDFDTGKPLTGTITGTFNTGIVVSEVGSLATITIDTGTLTLTLTNLPSKDCPPGFTCYNFTGGSVTVDQGGSKVFSDSLSSGLAIKNDNVLAIAGALLPNSGVGRGTVVATLDFQGQKILTGSNDVSFSTTVPEPGALEGLLLGGGLLASAEMARRKLQFGT